VHEEIIPKPPYLAATKAFSSDPEEASRQIRTLDQIEGRKMESRRIFQHMQPTWTSSGQRMSTKFSLVLLEPTNVCS
jgi:hypothetical protein